MWLDQILDLLLYQLKVSLFVQRKRNAYCTRCGTMAPRHIFCRNQIVNMKMRYGIVEEDGFTMVEEETFVGEVFCSRTVTVTESRESSRRSIRIQDIEFSRLLGSGGFGSVFEGRYGGKKVAVKRMHACTRNRNAAIESFRAELNVINLRHPNIIRTIAASSGDVIGGEAFIVMEYAGERTLLQTINDPNEHISFERLGRYALDISSALHFSHERGIVHLDLKPANILITQDDRCKVGDFGCCQRLENNTGTVSPTKRSELTGTYAYRAPELLRGEPPTALADVYAFGVTLWQLLTREVPYDGENPHVVIFGVVAYHLRPPLPEHWCKTEITAFYKKLISRCWCHSLEMRPTSTELVKSLYAFRRNQGRRRRRLPSLTQKELCASVS